MSDGASEYWSNMCSDCGDSHRSPECTDVQGLRRTIKNLRELLEEEKTINAKLRIISDSKALDFVSAVRDIVKGTNQED